jgi:hypothetical protein
VLKNLIEPRQLFSLNSAIASWLHAEWRYSVALNRLQFGNKGESAPIDFLKENDYRVFGKNFSSKLWKIVVVTEQVRVIVFIEVKARSDHKFGYPFDVLTPTKP